MSMKKCEVCNTGWYLGDQCPTCKKSINLQDTYKSLLRKTEECEKSFNDLEAKINSL